MKSRQKNLSVKLRSDFVNWRERESRAPWATVVSRGLRQKLSFFCRQFVFFFLLCRHKKREVSGASGSHLQSLRDKQLFNVYQNGIVSGGLFEATNFAGRSRLFFYSSFWHRPINKCPFFWLIWGCLPF